MRSTLALLLVCLLAPASAWSALEIGDFTLGMPQQAVVETLGKHFSTVDLVDGAYYQVPSRYYQAQEPTGGYNLDGVPISRVQATFNEAGKLKQVSVTLDTTDLERVHRVIPLTQKAREVPDTSGRLEAILEEGELVYYISDIWDWTVITIADKATSASNIQARARSDVKFKELSNKIDNVIDTMKKNQMSGPKAE